MEIHWGQCGFRAIYLYTDFRGVMGIRQFGRDEELEVIRVVDEFVP